MELVLDLNKRYTKEDAAERPICGRQKFEVVKKNTFFF